LNHSSKDLQTHCINAELTNHTLLASFVHIFAHAFAAHFAKPFVIAHHHSTSNNILPMLSHIIIGPLFRLKFISLF
jgi:hypothetical protein